MHPDSIRFPLVQLSTSNTVTPHFPSCFSPWLVPVVPRQLYAGPLPAFLSQVSFTAFPSKTSGLAGKRFAPPHQPSSHLPVVSTGTYCLRHSSRHSPNSSLSVFPASNLCVSSKHFTALLSLKGTFTTSSGPLASPSGASRPAVCRPTLSRKDTPLSPSIKGHSTSTATCTHKQFPRPPRHPRLALSRGKKSNVFISLPPR